MSCRVPLRRNTPKMNLVIVVWFAVLIGSAAAESGTAEIDPQTCWTRPLWPSDGSTDVEMRFRTLHSNETAFIFVSLSTADDGAMCRTVRPRRSKDCGVTAVASAESAETPTVLKWAGVSAELLMGCNDGPSVVLAEWAVSGPALGAAAGEDSRMLTFAKYIVYWLSIMTIIIVGLLIAIVLLIGALPKRPIPLQMPLYTTEPDERPPQNSTRES